MSVGSEANGMMKHEFTSVMESDADIAGRTTKRNIREKDGRRQAVKASWIVN